MVFIYVLKLTYGKFYIGKTTNPYFRLDNHFNSNGSAWTMKYKPIKVLELIPNCDDYDEDKYTRKYMDKYGFDNVRCGSFVSIELDKITIQYLTRMSNGTKDKCFICSKSDHFAKDCSKKNVFTVVHNQNYNKKITNQKQVKHYEDECEDEEETDEGYENKGCCFRCGREGHYVTSCYASKHIKCYYLD